MQKYDWQSLNKQQLGKYAEYYVKMELTMYGFQVFTPEVDDRGVDLIARFGAGPWFEIQVKSLRDDGYIFMTKDKFIPSSTLFAAVALFIQGSVPDLFLIPSTEWQSPNTLLRDRLYEKDPEWGINVSKKNQPLLKTYDFDTIAQTLTKRVTVRISDSESSEWTALGAQNLARAYGDDEPEYTTADLKVQ